MKKSFILLFLFLGTSSTLLSQEANTLKIEGKAEIDVIPDLMVYDLKISISTKNQKESIDSLNQIVNTIVKQMVIVGIQADSITTNSFNITLINDRFNPEKNVQYTASQNISFTSTTRSEDILAILNALSDLDLPYQLTNQTRLSKEFREKLEFDLIQAALDNAKEKARQIAKAGKLKISGISGIDYLNGYNPFGQKLYMLSEEVNMDYQSSKRTFGNYNVSTMNLNKSVLVSFKIK